MKKKISLIIIIAMLSILIVPTNAQARTKVKKCIKSGCNNTVTTEGSSYCYAHKCSNIYCKSAKYKEGYCSTHYNEYKRKKEEKKNSTTTTSSTKKYSSSNNKTSSSSSKKKYTNSYDDGYDDIYMNEDYDHKRYQKDSSYARGVDDAMEDAYDDFGDDW